MKKLLKIADIYVQESDWKVIAVLKFCLISLGISVGMAVPEKCKKPTLLVCAGVFGATYVPLMAKMGKLIGREWKNVDPEV